MAVSCVTISPDPRFRPRLVVMLKEPRVGRVKTRLGRDIGLVDATWWFRHQVRRLLRELDDPRWQLVLAVTPDHTVFGAGIWPARLPRVAQGGGDLGARMARLMHNLPAGPVCIVGADIPAIRRNHIARAFKALGNHQAVFGPATDGGYWLVGMKRIAPPPPAVFENVRWSTAHALADSRASMAGLNITEVDRLQDVDTAADL